MDPERLQGHPAAGHPAGGGRVVAPWWWGALVV